jgi:hypothetical protein
MAFEKMKCSRCGAAFETVLTSLLRKHGDNGPFFASNIPKEVLHCADGRLHKFEEMLKDCKVTVTISARGK